MPKLFGYARVSTTDQDVESQKNALIDAGVHPSDIFEEVKSSRKVRPVLVEVINKLEKGDTLVVYALDRIGRSLSELINTCSVIDDKGANIKTLTGHMVFDTSTSTGRLFFNIMAVFAEYEREVIRERTIAGLQNARAKNQKLGRPNKLTEEQIKELNDRHKRGWTRKELCECYNISKSTLYRYIVDM